MILGEYSLPFVEFTSCLLMADLRLYNFAFLYVYTSLLSFTIYSTSMHKFILLQKSLAIEQVLGIKQNICCQNWFYGAKFNQQTNIFFNLWKGKKVKSLDESEI